MLVLFLSVVIEILVVLVVFGNVYLWNVFLILDFSSFLVFDMLLLRMIFDGLSEFVKFFSIKLRCLVI